MSSLALIVASMIVGVGLLGLALHGDLGEVIDWFFASYAAPIVESLVSALLLCVVFRAISGLYRDRKYRRNG